MTVLHLVRHGPTHARSMVGWSDIPADLSDTEALARLSAHLPRDGIVISSDLSRAVQTADAIQGDRVRLPHRKGLRELHFGTWELRSAKDIEAEDPELARAFWENPGDVRPPNGESWFQASRRIDAAVDDLIAAHSGSDLIVVAHFGMILTQLQRALQIDADQVFAHRIDNLSVTSLTHLGDRWDVGAINHLP